MLPADERPEITSILTPYQFVLKAYGGLIEPFTAGPSSNPDWWLHLSLHVREGVPGVSRKLWRLLVDVFEPGAEDIRQIRDQFIAQHARTDGAFMDMVYAHALSAEHLDPMTRPWLVIHYWDEPLPTELYLETIFGPISRGLVANVVYEVVIDGHRSTLIVEAFSSRETWLASQWWRDKDWYHSLHLKPPSTHQCSIISARLPGCEREFRIVKPEPPAHGRHPGRRWKLEWRQLLSRC